MRTLWRRVGYRPWARLLHHFDLHHTRRIGPMEDGATIHRCEWCGASRREVPMWLTEQRMRASRSVGDPDPSNPGLGSSDAGAGS
jgi:hypothetical protein